jgi:hypothetical protein
LGNLAEVNALALRAGRSLRSLRSLNYFKQYPTSEN